MLLSVHLWFSEAFSMNEPEPGIPNMDLWNTDKIYSYLKIFSLLLSNCKFTHYTLATFVAPCIIIERHIVIIWWIISQRATAHCINWIIRNNLQKGLEKNNEKWCTQNKNTSLDRQSINSLALALESSFSKDGFVYSIKSICMDSYYRLSIFTSAHLSSMY